jgi:hypothetical protein
MLVAWNLEELDYRREEFLIAEVAENAAEDVEIS